jgi:peptidoglycan/LPS O-acetylase OafA/YrhL
MIVFTLSLGLCRVRAGYRIAILFILGSYCLSQFFWAAFLFIMGMVIAEVEAMLEAMEFTVPTEPLKRIAYNTFFYGNLLFALIVLGWPYDEARRDPLLRPIDDWTPKMYLPGSPKTNGGTFAYRFWECIGAVQLVWCMFRLSWLQAPFTSRLSMYLGDISYALYIVHIHWIISFGKPVHRFVNSIYNVDSMQAGQMTLFFANFIEISVIGFVVFWEADLFWRFIDLPSVTFAKWIESKLRQPQAGTVATGETEKLM